MQQMIKVNSANSAKSSADASLYSLQLHCDNGLSASVQNHSDAKQPMLGDATDASQAPERQSSGISRLMTSHTLLCRTAIITVMWLVDSTSAYCDVLE